MPVLLVPLDDVKDALEAQHLLHDVLQWDTGEREAPILPFQRDVFGPQLDEVIFERRFVLEVALRLALLDLVERRLRDEHVSLLDQLLELPVEQGQQQRADVRAVDVGVGHDDDGVVA